MSIWYLCMFQNRQGQTESLALFFLLAATMLVPYLVFLEPLGAGMVEIKKEMCAGNQTFVVADNPEVQEIIGYRTQAFNGQDAAMWLQVFESQVFFKRELGCMSLWANRGQMYPYESNTVGHAAKCDST